MDKDEYIKLYEDTYKIHRPKTVSFIKLLLLNYKKERFNSNTACNKICQLFYKLENNDITNSKEFKHLFEIYRKSRSLYQSEYNLDAIPKNLKPAFEEIQNPSMSFINYVKCLAKRECNFDVGNDFSNARSLYELMFELDKFQDYEGFKYFDIISEHHKNYSDIFENIYQLVYPSNNSSENSKAVNTEKLEKINPFKFNRIFIEKMKSEEVFNILVEEFFAFETTYDDYLNIFFEDVSSHKSKIKLKCETRHFSLFLSMMKKEIATKVSYTKIEKYKLFETNHSHKILSRDNISSSKKNPTKKEEESMRSFIDLTFKS
ncbi:MAG: hypothetical protein CMC14_07440 [Flavobacteriaceae bacterium]|nr:hypothetical protein [Flavobacteriaceae bacterium]